MKTHITLKDIAEEAGVSKTIVSRIINGTADGKVSLEKRKIIESLIKKYDYVPFSAAKSLATHRNRQIAFLLSDATTMLFENQVFAQMLKGVLDGCRRDGYVCQVDYCNFHDISTFVMPENLRRRCVDGCILTGALSEEVLEELTRIRIPSVLLGGERVRNRIPVITRTSCPEYKIFLKYCYEHGHRRILIAGCGRNGFENYSKLAKEFHGMKLDLRGNDDAEASARIARDIDRLPEPERPTMIAGSDHFCVELSLLLRKNGIICPRDISFISQVESEFTRLHDPPFTTFSADFVNYGQCGAKLLIDMLEHNLALDSAIEKAISMDLKSVFIERGSVRKIMERNS